jgi:hypothetical protein
MNLNIVVIYGLLWRMCVFIYIYFKSTLKFLIVRLLEVFIVEKLEIRSDDCFEFSY